MGRPEKPPSSAYSLFSKEMLNTEAIKQFPSKERMSHISDAWKRVSLFDLTECPNFFLFHFVNQENFKKLVKKIVYT